MISDNAEFLARLLETFREEASEHLRAISNDLITLEHNDGTEQSEIIERIFRETHSLKGAARAVGLKDIESVCQNMENVFSLLKKNTLSLSNTIFDTSHNTVSTLENLLKGEEDIRIGSIIADLKAITLEADVSSQYSETPLPREKSDEIPRIENQSSIKEGLLTPDLLKSKNDNPFEDKSPVLQDNQSLQTIRISSDRLEIIFNKADDLTSVKVASAQLVSDLEFIHNNFKSWWWNWLQISSSLEYFKEEEEFQTHKNGQNKNKIENLISFITYSRNFIISLEEEISRLQRSASRKHYALESAATELIDELKQAILVPAGALFENYPRLARDLGREQGKEIHVEVIGAEIEIDRRIIEILSDPLMHLFRNAIDHGIETPDIRKKSGKNSFGTILFTISHYRAHRVSIRVEDDGKGINTGLVRKTAIKREIITEMESENLSEDEIIRLILRSGLSTSPVITPVSGRGLGLAIVYEKIEKIGGTIEITSSPQGSCFSLDIPISLANFRGVMIESSGKKYIFPLSSIERVFQIHHTDLKSIESRPVIEIQDETIAVQFLSHVLGVPSPEMNESKIHYVVLFSFSGNRSGLLVDTVIGTNEYIVKPLGSQLRKVKGVIGGTILSDGEVVPVLSIDDLSNIISVSEPSSEFSKGLDLHQPLKSRILVVEDSITSRMLLKNILEASGYQVETAIDGVDALTKLKTEPVDLVVSDVDMPRMNGFSLTEKIRNDNTLSDLPIILVTSLDSREDREHGVRVGANAYIVKSSFDQTNLLDVIRRLII